MYNHVAMYVIVHKDIILVEVCVGHDSVDKTDSKNKNTQHDQHRRKQHRDTLAEFGPRC